MIYSWFYSAPKTASSLLSNYILNIFYQLKILQTVMFNMYKRQCFHYDTFDTMCATYWRAEAAVWTQAVHWLTW